MSFAGESFFGRIYVITPALARYGRTDEWTNPLIEIRDRITNENTSNGKNGGSQSVNYLGTGQLSLQMRTERDCYVGSRLTPIAVGNQGKNQ